MRISDWSSDVCSSDLPRRMGLLLRGAARGGIFLDDGDDALAQLRVLVHRLADAIEFIHGQAVGLDNAHHFFVRFASSEARRVGTECVRTCRSRWSRDNYKKNEYQKKHIAIHLI